MRVYAVVLLSVALLVPGVDDAPAATVSTTELFARTRQRPDEVDRYAYLLATFPRLSPGDRGFALQLLAATENELGLYSEALRDFPLHARLPKGLTLPLADQWEAVDAVDTIATLAAKRQIVLINEAHHDAHTRVLTLALLPRLRALGYRYFAAEAVDEKDIRLADRGYPLRSSGSEYLHEPVYGDLLRQAIALGFTIVPYESAAPGQGREDDQAQHLYQRVFKDHPHARLLVHAGYAHIDKAPLRLGAVQPMAMRLQKLTGIVPLSIDQTDVRQDDPETERYAAQRARGAADTMRSLGQTQNEASRLFKVPPRSDFGPLQSRAYARLVDTYRPQRAIVLHQRGGEGYWSARPAAYDMNVLLPPVNDQPSDYTAGPLRLRAHGQRFSVLPPAAGGQRPRWLLLDGTRRPAPIASNRCRGSVPCLVEAHYAGEPDTAVAADRYLFLQAGKTSALYLRPGAYRIRYVNAQGAVADRQSIKVSDLP